MHAEKMAMPKYSQPYCEFWFFLRQYRRHNPGSTFFLLEMADRMSAEAIISKPLHPCSISPKKRSGIPVLEF
jgi:hypothetical protein